MSDNDFQMTTGGYIVCERRDGVVILADEYATPPYATIAEAREHITSRRESHERVYRFPYPYDLVIVELRVVS